MADEARAIRELQAPFSDGRPSIRQLIRDAAARRGSEARDLELRLPEEPSDEPEDRQIRFVAGGLDALFGGSDRSPKQVRARSVVAALAKVSRQPNFEGATALYKILKSGRTHDIVDETLERLRPERDRGRDAIAALARRLILEAPDVEPVKMAIALLGISGEPSDEDLLIEMGQSDEFTLFSVVALSNLLPESESAIWRTAQRVHGWGRICAVERLANTTSPAIKGWLLRGGFRNSIMNEYLAHLAATTGGLLDALSVEEIDDELLHASADLIAALISGGPAEDLRHYVDGAAASIEFLRHAAANPTQSLRIISTVSELFALVDERRDHLKGIQGWTPQMFLDVRTLSASLLQRPDARAAVEAGLRSDELWGDYWTAAHIAPRFGIDPWPSAMDRQRRRVGDNWWRLMQTTDASRIDQVIALATEQLDLDLVGSGPTESLGIGAGFESDQAADFIVQDLGNFVGHGWVLIEVALRGRTIRLRNMAIKALDGWGRAAWPPEACEAIDAAIRREPDSDVRNRLKALLAGKPID